MSSIDETIRVQITIPRELVDAVDALVGKQGRRAFFTQAVAEKLEREQLGHALAATAGFLADDSRPEWATPETISA
ncbi:MAG: hypothetical protein ACRERD_14140 [Candidatus Binatia bacterium]